MVFFLLRLSAEQEKGPTKFRIVIFQSISEMQKRLGYSGNIERLFCKPIESDVPAF